MCSVLSPALSGYFQAQPWEARAARSLTSVREPSRSARTQMPSGESTFGASILSAPPSRTAWPSSMGEPSGSIATGTSVRRDERGTFQAQVCGWTDSRSSVMAPLASLCAPTSVTTPSSTSGSMSIISKMRSAPARAESMEVICCETWLIGWEICRTAGRPPGRRGRASRRRRRARRRWRSARSRCS